jgi:hypothetical protein
MNFELEVFGGTGRHNPGQYRAAYATVSYMLESRPLPSDLQVGGQNC